MSVTITPFGPFRAALGECPRWDVGALWMMDCRKGLILSLDGQGAPTVRAEVPAPAGSFAVREAGGFVVALKEEVALIGPDGSRRSVGRIADSHPNLRLNDGTVLPDGSFLTGTMHVFREAGEPPLGGIYRLAPDLSFHKVAPAVGVANGPCMGPDNRLYLADSAAKSIFRHAIAKDGTLSDIQPFADLAPLGSAPDGCCFDDQGGLWTALVHAGAVVRLDAGGQVSQRIDLPVRHPAALCFGGAALDQMFVTSISDSGRLRADGPLDGAVLCVTGHGRRGLPARSFAG